MNDRLGKTPEIEAFENKALINVAKKEAVEAKKAAVVESEGEAPPDAESPPEMSEEERLAKERAYNARRPVVRNEAQETFNYRPGAYLGYGDGKIDCPLCRGKGVVDLPYDPLAGCLVPTTRKCTCILARDVLANVERGWPGLTKAAKVPVSPLRGKEGKSLWVTAEVPIFKAHLRHAALRMGPNWDFLVTSDADLMKAWLATAVAQAVEIFDADVASTPTYEFVSLDDLVVPPSLLVIILGVKAAKNKAMSEVLVETLRLRVYRNQPTWIVDQPSKPLQHGHIAYSEMVVAEMDGWPQISLALEGAENVTGMPPAESWCKSNDNENDLTVGGDGPEDDTLSGKAPTGMDALLAKSNQRDPKFKKKPFKKGGVAR